MTETEKEALAAEFALGLLDTAQTARCEALAVEDADFAARVEAWRRNLIEIDLAAIPEPPPDALWHRIEAGMAGTGAAPSPRARAKTTTNWLSGLWSYLPAWRAAGLAAMAACLVLAIALTVQIRSIARTPVLVAVMMSDQSRPLALVNTFRDGRAELVPLEALSAPAGKSLQVWTLWDRARGPVSVGLLEAMRSMKLTVNGLPAPIGGSCRGSPTRISRWTLDGSRASRVAAS